MMKMSLHRRAAALSGLVAALTAAIAGGLAPVASQTQSTPPQCLTAAETHFRGRSGGIESFNNIISRQPMRFGELLGRSHSEIMPDEQLAIAEEYRDDEVRYTAFFGLDFCARTWDFLSKDSCIGGFSHLVVFFNRGHAFRVQMRFLSSRRNPRPPICDDHASLLRDIARQLDGSEIRRGDGRIVMSLTGDTGTALIYESGGGVIEWFLVGAPLEPGKEW